MPIYVSQRILDEIRFELSRSQDSFTLISAYCKLPLVQYFDSCISSSQVKKKLVVRMKKCDITSGATDLSIVPYCKQHGWDLLFRLDLHAKTYIFDRLRCIVGSANATNSGMSIGGSGNYEMATSCMLTPQDLRAIDMLLSTCTPMTDAIYSLMVDSISNPVRGSNSDEWPVAIQEHLIPNYPLLFAEDFPWCSSPFSASEDDLIFLGITPDADMRDIREAFLQSKCYNWLLALLNAQDNQYMYFGAISAALHGALLNDPKPYRKDVKILLSNLLGWIEELGCPEIGIDRPNYSQRIFLITNDDFLRC